MKYYSLVIISLSGSFLIFEALKVIKAFFYTMFRALGLFLLFPQAVFCQQTVESAFGSLKKLEETRNFEEVEEVSTWLLKQDLNDSLRFTTQWYLIRAKFGLKEYDEAKATLRRQLVNINYHSRRDSIGQYNTGSVFMDLGRASYFQGQSDSARTFMDSASAWFRLSGNYEFYAKCVFNQSIISKNMGENGRAFESLMQAKKTLVRSNDTSTLMILYAEIANTLGSMNLTDSCFYYSNKAIELALLLPDSTSLGVYYSNQAQFLVNAHRYREGLKSATKAIEIKTNFKPSSGLSFAYGSKGRALEGLGKHDSALLMHRKALSSERRTSSSYAASLQNIGSVLETMGELDSAEHYYQMALGSKRQNKIGKGRISNYLGLASVSLMHSKPRTAKTYLDSVKTELLVYKDYRHIVDYYDLYARYHILTGNAVQAGKSIDLKDTYIDSLNNQERAARVDGLQTLFEVKAKEAAIAQLDKENALNKLQLDNKQLELARRNQQVLLACLVALLLVVVVVVYAYYYRLKKKRNAQLLSQNQTIEEQNEQLKQLNREIYHRTKNHLQNMTSLLSVQKYQLKDANARELIQENENRMHAMGLLHKRLFAGESIERLHLSSFCDELVKDLAFAFNMPGHFKPSISIKNITVSPDTMVPLTLVINELLTNAFKYGLKHPNPELEISGSFKENDIIISVKDNGPGFESPSDQNISGSFGMELIYSMISQMNGQITFRNERGAVIEVVVPKV